MRDKAAVFAEADNHHGYANCKAPKVRILGASIFAIIP